MAAEVLSEGFSNERIVSLGRRDHANSLMEARH